MKVSANGVLAVLLASAQLFAQTCTTQSKMSDADRAALKAASESIAAKIAANDQAGVRAVTIPQFQQDFSGMANEISSTAPALKGAQPEVDEIYILDASSLAKTATGGNPDAQFYCTLNNSPSEAEFNIPGLPPGKYAFAMVEMTGATPWRLSFLLQQQGSQWLLAGLYPKPLSAAGHDGLWYWTQARTLAANKQPWNSWLYLTEAQTLLTPVGFIGSTHLDKLQAEVTASAPPAVSGGINPESPLVVKAADGTEFRFTAIAVDDSLHSDKVDVAAHIKVDAAAADTAAARKRNVDAMTALVAAHPELRQAFHGVWIFADAPGQSPYGTELAMAEIK